MSMLSSQREGLERSVTAEGTLYLKWEKVGKKWENPRKKKKKVRAGGQEIARHDRRGRKGQGGPREAARRS